MYVYFNILICIPRIYYGHKWNVYGTDNTSISHPIYVLFSCRFCIRISVVSQGCSQCCNDIEPSVVQESYV